MTEKKPQFSYEQSLKSLDTEEFIDLKFYRPLGYRWALFFNKVGATPNFVSVLSIFLGVAAGVLFYFSNIWLNILGMLLLVWANTYDSADGQLARLTKNFSKIGRILDGACGDIWFITIYIAVCLRLYPTWGMYIWLLAAFAGFWHSKQASLADYYRNFHLFFVKGKNGSELDDSESVEKEYKSCKFSNDPLFKIFMWFYKGYTKKQESVTPQMQLFRKCIKTKYNEQVPSALAEEFRLQSKPLMKYTNMLSFNTRVIALFISLLIDMPWLYFVFEIVVLNIMLFYMVIKHERICRYFYTKCGA
ncbi:MAG: CDP-alcohol phosphatidyltransferase family protein [Bacteroidales bacterium]|nr:CDP-alcohol phosphatidyltransferase family protein [Bacteroidales bacterium]